jgi:hypothetical protein
VRRVGHDKRGGAADQNARRAWSDVSGDLCDTSRNTDLASPDLASTVCFCIFMHACMLVSPARRRSGLDSTCRGVAPAALNVVRSGRQPI